jgi:hypothetical protein
VCVLSVLVGRKSLLLPAFLDHAGAISRALEAGLRPLHEAAQTAYDCPTATWFPERFAVHIALRERLLGIAEAALAAWQQQQQQQPPRQLCSLLTGLLKFRLELVNSSPVLLMLHVLHALRTAAAAAAASSMVGPGSTDTRGWLLLAGPALWVFGTAAAQLEAVAAAAAAAVQPVTPVQEGRTHACQVVTEWHAERRALQQLSLAEHWTAADVLQRCCEAVQLLGAQVDALQLELPGVLKLQQQRKRLVQQLDAAGRLAPDILEDSSSCSDGSNGDVICASSSSSKDLQAAAEQVKFDVSQVAAAFTRMPDQAGQQQQQQQRGSLAQQVVQYAAAACALLPSSSMCGNPGCISLGGVSEKQQVSQSSTRCSGCKQARFCCRACQLEAWPAHRKVCKALAAAQAKDSKAEK